MPKKSQVITNKWKKNMTKEGKTSLKAIDKRARAKIAKAKERKKIETKYRGLPSVIVGTKTNVKKVEEKVKKKRKWEYNKRRMSPNTL